MDDDTEQVDWGNDDEENYKNAMDNGDALDDNEDAVSLGSGIDDALEFEQYQSLRVQKDNEDTQTHRDEPRLLPPPSPPPPARRHARGENSRAPRHSHSIEDASSFRETHPRRSCSPQYARQSSSQGVMTYPLPPKPQVVSSPYVLSPRLVIQEPVTMATTMSIIREKRSYNGEYGGDSEDTLPSQRDTRLSRSDEEYDYDSKSRDKTWARPQNGGRGDRSPSRYHSAKGRAHDGGHAFEETATSLAVRPDVPTNHPTLESRLSYNDRHYRPGGLPSEIATNIDVSDDDRFVPNAAYTEAQAGSPVVSRSLSDQISGQRGRGVRRGRGTRWGQPVGEGRPPRENWEEEPKSVISDHTPREWVSRDTAREKEHGQTDRGRAWDAHSANQGHRHQESSAHANYEAPPPVYEDHHKRKPDEHWPSAPSTLSSHALDIAPLSPAGASPEVEDSSRIRACFDEASGATLHGALPFYLFSLFVNRLWDAHHGLLFLPYVLSCILVFLV